MWRSTAVRRRTLDPGSAIGCESVGRLRRLREFLERLAGAGDQRRRDRRRDLRHRNVNAIRPRRQHVVEDARRFLRPVVPRGRFEIRHAGMIVDVADEQHRDRALVLRRQRLAPHRRRLGRDDAVEGAVRIALARLVIEREDDLAFHVAVVVVVAEVRRADAEAHEGHLAGRVAARAVAMGIEVLARAQVSRGGVGRDEVERAALAERRGHQVVRLEVRVVRAGRLQAHALEPRSDEVGGRAILFRVGQPSAHRIAGEKEEIGAEILLADRFVLRRASLGARRSVSAAAVSAATTSSLRVMAGL